MWAGRVTRLPAEPIAPSGRAAVGHRARIGERDAFFELRDVAGLGQHVANAVITVVDLAAIVG